MIKRLLALALIPLLLTPALAYDVNKLLKLKPLPSERFERLTRNYENTKLYLSLGSAGAGAWLIYNNLGKGYEAYRVYNTISGYTFLVMGGLQYFARSAYVTDRLILDDLYLNGSDRELNAYFLIKSYAEKNKTQREYSGAVWLLSGVVGAVLANSSNGLTDNDKIWADATAVGLVAMGLYSLFVPSDVEKEEDQIEKELK
ncbi:MAG: hypothetical protein WC529_05520 [Candidatus Margulisiibacteriota bacterium]